MTNTAAGVTGPLPTTMTAAVCNGRGGLRLTLRPVPHPDSEEVLVRMAMCGICGTDLKILDGQLPRPRAAEDIVPGHEWTGTVVACGDNVDEFRPGDRVCIEAQVGCGRCENCLTGQRTICLNFADVSKGHRATGLTIDGGFAEYVLHGVQALHRIPDNVSFADAVLITTAGTGLHGLEIAGGQLAGRDVAVFGPGPLGLMTTQLCTLFGAARTFLAGTRESRLAAGTSLGASHVIDVRRTDPVQSILGLTSGKGVDLAVEASGDTAVPQQCVDVTKPGGRILAIAYYPDHVLIDLTTVVRKSITLYTARGEGGNSVRQAVALAAAGRLRGAELVTHTFPLANITEAVRVVRERDGDPIKVVITP